MAPPLTLTTLSEEKKIEESFILEEKDRPKLAYNEFSNDIPVISLEGIEEDYSGGGRREIIRNQITEACKEWGVFQVVNHGIHAKLLEDMSNLSMEFFTLPDEEKLRFDICGAKKGGFVVSSHIRTEVIANWREMVVYATYPIKDRDYTCWPDKPKEWREVTEAYSEKLMGLAATLLEVLAEALGLEKESITKACKDICQRMSVNYYPKCPDPSVVLGLKRHTDPGTITLLLQDQVGGLQVTKDDGLSWVTVQPIKGAFVVNLGDHFYHLCNGKFKCGDHQAVVNSDYSRLSIATFITPHQDSIVYPLNINEGDKSIMEEPITYGEFYKRRLNYHVEQSKLKKLAHQQNLNKEDIDKLMQNCGKDKTIKELLV